MTEAGTMGMLDVGEHCVICRQRDFLPFVCVKCHSSYCQTHKSQFNEHNCEQLISGSSTNKIDISHLPSSKSVFPNLKEIRSREINKPKTINLNKSSQRLGGSNGSNSNVMSSLDIALQRLKRLLPTSSKSNGSTPTPIALRMAERVNLRKVSKGDEKIKQQDRIYIWCISIDNESKSDKTGIWVNKNWSLGKILDYIATQMKIQNINNKTLNNDERLFLFDSNFKNFVLNQKANTCLKDGDIVYLVKGGGATI